MNQNKENQHLLKSLEESFAHEKLLREISYLIISDKSVKEIAQKIAESLCNYLKIERCLIHDNQKNKINFIVEFCNNNAIPIINENEKLRKYIELQNSFYKDKRSDTKNSAIFLIKNVQEDDLFSKLKKTYEDFSINSQIIVITSFDHEINGAIYLHSSQNRNFSNKEIELIELVADQFAIALDRSYSIEKVIIANHNLITRTLELKEAIKKEKEMRKMQAEFVSLVSHEFKTPLQIIDSTREVIIRKLKNMGSFDEVLEGYFARIRSGILRMNNLINGSLNLAKIEANNGEIKTHKSDFDLIELIADIIEKLNNLALNNNIKISAKFITPFIKINADYKMMDHCFSNIISNAIKYSRENSEIKISVKLKNDQIIAKISDHGIGIPEDDLENIGKKFFRAKNSILVSGTGIGIYLTKFFVELHGGNVLIESKLNVGTSVTITLPIK